MIGFKIGSYEIVEPLGQGTSTTTYLARDDRGKEAVAKRLMDWLAADEAVVERFLAAVELSGKIRMRKHVAMVHAQKRSCEGVFLLRQYVEGESLARLAEQGKLSTMDRDQVARDLCEAVRAMASREVVHGGLHPGNVIVQPDGRVKVTDFGVSLAVLAGSVPPSYPLPSLPYLAPEQWRGAQTTPRTDIYSAAAIIALVDRGKAIFCGNDRRQLEQEILAGRDECCPVLAAALHPEPLRRYASIDELRARLPNRKDAPPPLGSPPEPPEPPETEQRNHESRVEPPAPPATTSTASQTVPPTDSEPPVGVAEPPAVPQPPPVPPVVPPSPGGSLESIFDVKQRRNLLESLPPKPWTVARDGRRQQRPLQVSNGGPGDLELWVSCAGEGVSASPARVVVSPQQMAAVIVRLEPESSRFANLIFRWQEGGNERNLIIKIVRSG